MKGSIRNFAILKNGSVENFNFHFIFYWRLFKMSHRFKCPSPDNYGLLISVNPGNFNWFFHNMENMKVTVLTFFHSFKNIMNSCTNIPNIKSSVCSYRLAGTAQDIHYCTLISLMANNLYNFTNIRTENYRKSHLTWFCIGKEKKKYMLR